MEKYEQDKAWLLTKNKSASENDIEAFQEKVAVFVSSYGMSEKDARHEAFFMMTGIFW